MSLSYPQVTHRISGNTSGTTALISSGTMFLQGGNNITLSQNGNSVEIIGATGGGTGGATFSAGVSTLGNTLGTTGTVSNQLVLAGGNNITLSQSSAAGGATITISGPNTLAFTAGVSTGGNTQGTTGTVSNGIVFVGSNNITLRQSSAAGGATITISGPTPVLQTDQTLGLYATSNTTQNSSTTLDARSLTFQGAGGLSVGYSNGSIVLSGASGGGAGQTFGSSHFGNERGWAQSSSSLGQNSLYLQPALIDEALSGSAFLVPVMVTNSSSAANAQTRGYTARFGVYTRNSTNSTVLSRHYSTSYTLSASASSNASWAMQLITGLGNATSYNTVSASSAGLNLSASLHGARFLIIPMQTTFTAGEYWFAWLQSSSTAGASNNLFNLSHIIASSQTVARMGRSVAASVDNLAQKIGLGTYSVATGALPDGISMTQINAAATNPIFYFGDYTS